MDDYNFLTNSSENYNSLLLKYNRSSLDPLNKNSLGNERELFLTYYNSVKFILFDKIEISGLDDLDKNLVINKILNGSAFFIKTRGKLYCLNGSVNDYNLNDEPIDLTINEPKSKYFNNKKYYASEENEMKEIVEVRFNRERWPLLLMVIPFIKQTINIFELMKEENNKIFDKVIIPTSLLNSQATKSIFDDIENSPKTFHALDFKASGITKLDSNTNLGLEKIVWSKETTERLIKKMEQVKQEMFSIIGIPFNNQSDKKGANVIASEIETDNKKIDNIFNHFIYQMNIGFEKVNKMFGTNIKVSIKEDKEKIEEKGNEDVQSMSKPKI